jgi:hypothetical protein
MSLRTLVFLPSGTPCAFFIKRRRDLRLRFLLVDTTQGVRHSRETRFVTKNIAGVLYSVKVYPRNSAPSRNPGRVGFKKGPGMRAIEAIKA